MNRDLFTSDFLTIAHRVPEFQFCLLQLLKTHFSRSSFVVEPHYLIAKRLREICTPDKAFNRICAWFMQLHLLVTTLQIDKSVVWTIPVILIFGLIFFVGFFGAPPQLLFNFCRIPSLPGCQRHLLSLGQSAQDHPSSIVS